MTSKDNMALANHILQSIQRDLAFLNSQQYLPKQAYDDILRILPNQISNNNTNYTSGYDKRAIPAAPMMPSGNNYKSSGSPSPAPAPAPPAYSTATSVETAEALYDFQGQNSDDLSFKRGDIIQVTEHVNSDWWRGTLRGRNGLFPSGYVEKRTNTRQEKPVPPPTPARNNTIPPPPANGNPYAYPPPPSAAVAPSPPSTNYGYPPPAQQYAPPPVQQYAPPPPVQPVPDQSHAETGNKAPGMLSSFGGKLADAATLGFGATLGSEAAHSIF